MSAYRHIACRWLQWLAQDGVSLDQVRVFHVQQYIEFLLQTRRPSTVVKELSVIRTMYRRLIDAGIVVTSPAQNVQVSLKGYISRPQKTPTAASVDRISATTLIGIRDRAIVRLRSIGLSTGQLVALDISDVNREAQSVRVQHRNHRDENVFLDDLAWKDISRWLAVREVVKPVTLAVFVSLHWTGGRSAPGQRISARAIALIMRRYVKA
jgi:site-specific recombinase XerC